MISKIIISLLAFTASVFAYGVKSGAQINYHLPAINTVSYQTFHHQLAPLSLPFPQASIRLHTTKFQLPTTRIELPATRILSSPVFVRSTAPIIRSYSFTRKVALPQISFNKIFTAAAPVITHTVPQPITYVNRYQTVSYGNRLPLSSIKYTAPRKVQRVRTFYREPLPIGGGEQPGPVPGFPVDQPGSPIEQPDVPIEQPGEPIEQPGAPIEQPEVPIEQPEVPIEQPDAPIEQPGAPIEQPEVPIEQPQEPCIPNEGFQTQQQQQTNTDWKK